jgi:hypothetical protein
MSYDNVYRQAFNAMSKPKLEYGNISELKECPIYNEIKDFKTATKKDGIEIITLQYVKYVNTVFIQLNHFKNLLNEINNLSDKADSFDVSFSKRQILLEKIEKELTYTNEAYQSYNVDAETGLGFTGMYAVGVDPAPNMHRGRGATGQSGIVNITNSFQEELKRLKKHL